MSISGILGFAKNCFNPLLNLSTDRLLMGAAIVAVIYLISTPLLMVLLTAFRGPIDYLPFESNAVFTLENFGRAYGSANIGKTIFDTATFAGGAVLLAFFIGFVMAWLVERTDIPLRNTIFVFALVPIMLPPIASSLAWIFLLGENNGLINVFIRTILPFGERGPFDIFSLYGMIIVQGFGMSTIMFLLVGAALRNMDSALEEASAASGARYISTLRRVTLPMLTPAILSVLILSFIFAIETFEVPLVIGLGARQQVFAGNVYWALNPASGLPRYGEVAALALSFLAFTYLLFYFYSRVTNQARRFATVTGKGFRPKRLELGQWKYPLLAMVIVFVSVQTIFPLLTLVWASFLDRFAPPTLEAMQNLSLGPYKRMFSDPNFGLAFRNTFIVAFGSALLVTTVSSIVAWIVVRGNARGKRLLDFIASSSVAIPGVIAGLSFVIFYITISRWIPLFGTIWVLVLAYSYRLSLGYRVNVAGLTQISLELEEASKASGARWGSTFKRILAPLMAPNLIVVFMIIFFLGFRDFTLALLLSSKENVVMSVLVWQRLQTNDLGEAAALSVLMVVVLFVLAAGLRRILMRRFSTF